MTLKKRYPFPYYESINDFLQSVSNVRTQHTFFCCLRLKSKSGGFKYKLPFRKGFYSIFFIVNSGEYQLYFDGKLLKKYNSFIVFQAPGLITSYSYNLSPETKGYVVFFKPEFFSYFKILFEKEFSFFNTFQTTFFEINNTLSAELKFYFEDVFSYYETIQKRPEQLIVLKTLTLFYFIQEHIYPLRKNETKERCLNWNEKEIFFQKFLQLIGNFYLEKRTVKEYAHLLSVSPTYLSFQIKNISNRKALSFINNKIVSEAKSLILSTDYSIREISVQLKFSDISNFTKFFKAQTGKPPLQYKRSKNALQ